MKTIKKACVLATSLFLASCVDGITTGFSIGLTANDSPLLHNTDNYSETTYPIVLVHGLYGFDDIFGMEYFYQIPQVLRNGGARVYIGVVSGTTTPEIRGEQLITQIEDFIALADVDAGGGGTITKVNLFGHSLGSPTIRYVASVRPDLVASVTSIGGANYGSEAANWDKLELPMVRGIVNVMGNALGHLIDAVSQNAFEQNIIATLNAMNDEGIAEFNLSYDEGLVGLCGGNNAADVVDNNILYYSWGGNKPATNRFDPLDILHKATAKLITAESDGMVQRCSTHLGFVIKDDYPMNHLDLMNWFLALRDDAAPYPPSIYRTQANRLKLQGL